MAHTFELAVRTVQLAYLFSLCPPDHSPAGRMAPEPPGGVPV